MKLFDVVVTTVTGAKHWIRYRCTSADRTMTELLDKFGTEQVYEMRVKEVRE
jgi:hypothetical protein